MKLQENALFIFFDEYNQFNTTQFLMMAIKYYGYIPNIIQTDNEPEFTSRNWHKVKKDSLFTDTCKLHNILHKTIRPKTPKHNGKVERYHRNDNNRFYQFLTFSSLKDLNVKGAKYLKYSNNICSSALGFLTPLQKKISPYS